MDQHTHDWIRLILAEADAQTKKAIQDRLETIYADRAAKGQLRSGATVKLALADIEEIATKFITGCVDNVTSIAKDVESFAMIQETFEVLLGFLAERVDDVAAMATGNSRHGARFERVLKAAGTLFADVQDRLHRQLEIQRFKFTVPSALATASSTPAPTAAKSEAGRPLAAHWDEMWSAIAMKIFDGDLHPNSQADIERAMRNLLADQDQYPSDAAIRQRARRLWQKWKKSENL